VLILLRQVPARSHQTSTRIGVKPAGGIRTTKDAIKQLVLVNETAGPEWLKPSLFRIGASALLNDLLMQRMKLRTGHYASANYVTID
jgi:deoxyribose-phosphate aldolase